MLPCSYPQRNGLLKDLITSFGAGGRTIIFTDSKKDAAELSVVLGDTLGAQALHGDLAQSMREQTLDGFRKVGEGVSLLESNRNEWGQGREKDQTLDGFCKVGMGGRRKELGVKALRSPMAGVTGGEVPTTEPIRRRG